MCSYFSKNNMENNYNQGDLTEIFHVSSGGAIDGGYTGATANPGWQFPISFSSDPVEDFGHPFTHIRDPLLNSSSTISVEESGNCLGFGTCSSFQGTVQISPNARVAMSSPSDRQAILKGNDHMLVSNINDHNLINSPNSSKGCLLESPQISSPRNTGIKRRKSQAKKVVCIPAPSPANATRSTGEIVPSDLWAWRKYGQKPIKGSPHPRGYYRCSSSKGCLARKQVERSRNDPNMLVITYTSEHNHPWPTQRNALAGSSRSQPSKNNPTSKKSTNPKEEHNMTITNEDQLPAHDPNPACVKEETDQGLDTRLEMDDPGFVEGFMKGYKPTLMDPNQCEDSFFSGLDEIEGEPLDLLFGQGFSGREYKGLDPFSFYDWVSNNGNINTSITTSTTSETTTMYEEAKRDS